MTTHLKDVLRKALRQPEEQLEKQLEEQLLQHKVLRITTLAKMIQAGRDLRQKLYWVGRQVVSLPI